VYSSINDCDTTSVVRFISVLRPLLIFTVVIVATMFEYGLSPLFDLNHVDQCQEILVKTIELLPLFSDSRSTLATRDNLKLLIDNYFQEDAFRQSFGSMIVYGKHDGVEVTLDHFNKFVMHPWSSNKFELQPASITLPHPIDSSAARIELKKNTLLLGYKISWFPNKDPAWCTGIVTQEFCLFHT
jgi:hypothetical protein